MIVTSSGARFSLAQKRMARSARGSVQRDETMPLAFVLDENCRGPLWNAIQSHNQGGNYPIDAVRVGDLPDLPLQCGDPEILAWAEGAGRILLTIDESTMPAHWIAHLQSGRHSPGFSSFVPKRLCAK